MHGTSMNLLPLSRPLVSPPIPHRLPRFSIPTCTHRHETPSLLRFRLRTQRTRNHCSTIVRASRRESPFEVLGLPPSATAQQIKRAYRKLALKYHPDVNKEANAQERFMRIKHAYNTLMSSEKSDFSNRGSDYSRASERNKTQTQQEEEFYGFGNFFKDVQITIADFLRDLQVEYQNWDAGSNSQEKIKSLWEELADIGEEFVEFLEKELNIGEQDIGEEFVEFLEKELNIDNPKPEAEKDTNVSSKGHPYTKSGVQEEVNIEDNIDDIEAALAQLKKELGL